MSAEIASMAHDIGRAHRQVRELAKLGMGADSLGSLRALLEETEALHATVQGLVMLLAQRQHPEQAAPFSPRQTGLLECEDQSLRVTYDAGEATLHCEGGSPAALGVELLRQFLPLVAAQLGVSEWGGREELAGGAPAQVAEDAEVCQHEDRIGVGHFSIVHGLEIGRGGVVVHCGECGAKEMRYRF